MTEFYIAVGVFFVAYALISLEKFHKTIVALMGAGIILACRVLTQSEAFYSEEFGVDWNVIILLISMMIIINVMKPTGLFEYIGIKSAKAAKGSPYRVMAIFAFVTAFVSAFLDNVTTVLLITPIIIFICEKLEVDAVPYLVVEALASNIGGTATLIGDPPNIMIASKANFTFNDFVVHLTPVIAVILAVFIVMLKLVFRKHLQTTPEARERIMNLEETGVIKDKKTLVISLVVLCLVIAGFVMHASLHLEPATVALAGAALLLLVLAVEEPHHIFADIEWNSLFFFIGLFVVVGAVVKVGFVKMLASAVIIHDGNEHAHGEHGHPLVLRCRFGDHRQHTLRRHHEPPHHQHGPAVMAGRQPRCAQLRPAPPCLVGPFPGGVPGRQRHGDRGIGKRRGCGHVGETGEKDIVRKIHALCLPVLDHVHRDLQHLSVAALFRLCDAPGLTGRPPPCSRTPAATGYSGGKNA